MRRLRAVSYFQASLRELAGVIVLVASWASASVVARAEVVEKWVRHYDGSRHCDDVPRDIALDGAGNLYVAGDSYGAYTDYAIVKYDSRGRELWVARYNGPGSRTDELDAMILDEQGNVYVTGGSVGEEPGYGYFDFATLKYDANGRLIWERRHQWEDPAAPPEDDEDLGWDKGTALALDSQGCLYVTGYVTTTRTRSDLVLLKYDPEGELKWLDYYDGEGHEGDVGYAVVVDANDDVYVAGKSYYDQYHGDPILLKYAPDGRIQWVRQHEGDSATGMVLDPAGYIILMVETGFPSDFVTIKYDLEGNDLWTATYDGPSHFDDVPRALAVDGRGNILVCGRSEGVNTSDDFATLKYNASGALLWESRYAGYTQSYDAPTAMALDDRGNVYVTGYTATLPDFLTVKYDRRGQQVWAVRHDGPANGRDHAMAIACKSRRVFYVTGSVQDDPYRDCVDFATIEYRQRR